MKHQLPDLPWPKDGLKPHISQETIEYHYGKHHQAYVDKLNGLIEGTEFADMPLEEIVKKSSGGIFNNGAQVFNHTFYWSCMKPDGGGEPTGDLAEAINKSFGSFDDFKKKMTTEATGLFGSGWCWLVKKADGALDIVPMANAGNPLTEGLTPLLTIDVWEHAYYIDKRNARPKYLEDFWNVVNWDFVAEQYG